MGDALAVALAAAGLPAGTLMALPPGNDASLAELLADDRLAAVAMAAPADVLAAASRALAERDGAIIPLIPWQDRPAASGGIGVPLAGTAAWLERFVHERTLTVDTTASGGNAALLSLDEDA